MTKHQGVLAERLLALPRRIEPLSGQQTSYVQLDSVIALVEQFDVSAALAAVQQETQEQCAQIADDYRAARVDPQFNPLAEVFNRDGHPVENETKRAIAAAIRALSAPKAPRPEAAPAGSPQQVWNWCRCGHHRDLHEVSYREGAWLQCKSCVCELYESRSPDGDGPAYPVSAGETDGSIGPSPLASRRIDARSATSARLGAGSEPADSHSTTSGSEPKGADQHDGPLAAQAETGIDPPGGLVDRLKDVTP